MKDVREQIMVATRQASALPSPALEEMRRGMSRVTVLACMDELGIRRRHQAIADEWMGIPTSGAVGLIALCRGRRESVTDRRRRSGIQRGDGQRRKLSSQMRRFAAMQTVVRV